MTERLTPRRHPNRPVLPSGEAPAPGFSERPGYVTLLSASPAAPRITDDGTRARSRSGG